MDKHNKTKTTNIILRLLKLKWIARSALRWKKINLSAFKAFVKLVGRSRGRTSRSLFRLTQSAILAFIFVLLIDIYIVNSNTSAENRIFGQFGDFLGGTLNPILTFLTFMALLITIVLQQTELRLTRKEISSTARTLEEQSASIQKQQFESTFFEILDQHNKILSDFKSKPVAIISTGSGLQSTKEYNLVDIRNTVYPRVFDYETELDCQPNVNFKEFGHHFSPYFRVLYQLLKFISENSPVSDKSFKVKEFDLNSIKSTPLSKQEKVYSDLVRSLLLDEVVHLLAAYCYCKDEKSPNILFKAMIIRYQLFEHMPFCIEGNPTRSFMLIYKHYGIEAFGNNLELPVHIEEYKKHGFNY